MLTGESPFDQMWQDLASKNRLAYCRDSFHSPGYTYHHSLLNQRKLDDHFLVSQTIIDDRMSSNYNILDEGENSSDHLPITMEISVSVQRKESDDRNDSSKPTLK